MVQTRAGARVNTGAGAAGAPLSAAKVLDGTRKFYYGPDQQIAALPQVYEPPTRWPEPGTPAKILRVVRFVWLQNHFGLDSDTSAGVRQIGSSSFGNPTDGGHPTTADVFGNVVDPEGNNWSTGDYAEILAAGGTTVTTATDDGGGTFTYDDWVYFPNPLFETGFLGWAQIAAALASTYEDSGVQFYVYSVSLADGEEWLKLLAPAAGETDYASANVLTLAVSHFNSLYDPTTPSTEYQDARSQVAEHFDNFPGYKVVAYADTTEPGDSPTAQGDHQDFLDRAVNGTSGYAGLGLAAYGFSYGGTVALGSSTPTDFHSVIETYFGL